MSNGGNIGKGLKQVGSKKNLKAMGTSALTAGGGNSSTVIGTITQKITQSAMNAGIDTAINGGKFGDKLVTNLKYAGASLAVESVVGVVSAGLASNDNQAPQVSPPTLGEHAIDVIGSTALNVGQQFAINSLAGEDPREALIKASASFAAQIACHGVSGVFGGLMAGFANDNDDDEERQQRAALPTQEEQEQRDFSLNSIINGIEDDENRENAQRRTPQENIFFEGQYAPSSTTIDAFFDGCESFGSNHPVVESAMVSIPWDALDQDLRTSPFGLAYNNQFPLDLLDDFYQQNNISHPLDILGNFSYLNDPQNIGNPLDDFYKHSRLYRDDDLAYWGFRVLSFLTQPLQDFEANNPEEAENIRESIQLLGRCGNAIPRAIIRELDPEGEKTLSEYEAEFGKRLGVAITDFAETAGRAGRTPWEKEQFALGALLAAETASVPLALLKVGKSVKGAINSVKGKFAGSFSTIYQGRKNSISQDFAKALDLEVGSFKYHSPSGNVVKLFDINQNRVTSVRGLVRQLPFEKSLVRGYIREMESITGRPIQTHQRLSLKQELQGKNFLKLSAEGKLQHRDLFRSRKNALITEWQRETKQIWPVYTKEIIKNQGVSHKKLGHRYDAHEIIPNQYGGPLQWHNLHPAIVGVQHQGGIHGKGSALSAIESQLKITGKQ